MSQFRYDLAVAYRVYPKPSSSKPSVYAEDKLKLVKFCFQSFKESFSQLKVKLFLILNSCPPEYEEYFRANWPAEDLVIHKYPGVPAGTTLHEQSRLLIEQTDAEFVYFAEDDYFFLPGQFDLGVEFMRKYADADFVGLYEHPLIHETDLHRMPWEKREYGGKTWLSIMSTTHCFLARRKILADNAWLFLTFNNNTNPDLGMWMALTKKRVYNVFKFLAWLPANRFWAGSIFLAWRYFWKQILFGRRYKLWVPTPCIATHMIATQEAPGIDWRGEFQKRIASGK